jgi:hypothetical protein
MPFDKSKNKMVPNKTAPPAARKETAGPGGSFPIGDKSHARNAISGAARSYDAGNISKSTEESIQAKARTKLGEGKGKGKK